MHQIPLQEWFYFYSRCSQGWSEKLCQLSLSLLTLSLKPDVLFQPKRPDTHTRPIHTCPSLLYLLAVSAMCYYIAHMVCSLPFCTQSYTNLLKYNVMWISSIKTKNNPKSKPWRKNIMKQKSIFVAVMDEEGICLWLNLTHRTFALKNLKDICP